MSKTRKWSITVLASLVIAAYEFWVWVVLPMKPDDVLTQTSLWWHTHWVRQIGFIIIIAYIAAIIFIWFGESIFAKLTTKNPPTTPPIKETPSLDALSATPKLPQASSADTIKPSDERIIVNVSPEYLCGLFKNHTSSQAQKLIEPYIGKWMKIAGRLEDFSDHPSFLCVYLVEYLIPNVQVNICFEPVWRNRLEILKLADQITLVGQIDKVPSKGSMVLEKCELLDE